MWGRLAGGNATCGHCKPSTFGKRVPLSWETLRCLLLEYDNAKQHTCRKRNAPMGSCAAMNGGSLAASPCPDLDYPKLLTQASPRPRTLYSLLCTFDSPIAASVCNSKLKPYMVWRRSLFGSRVNWVSLTGRQPTTPEKQQARPQAEDTANQTGNLQLDRASVQQSSYHFVVLPCRPENTGWPATIIHPCPVQPHWAGLIPKRCLSSHRSGSVPLAM